MRPSPDILHRWVDPGDPHADSLEVTTGHEDGLYGICHVTAAGVTPVNLRTCNPQAAEYPLHQGGAQQPRPFV